MILVRAYIISIFTLFAVPSIIQTGTVRAQELAAAFPARTFTKPVDLQHPGDGTNRLFVVEQPGIIRVFNNDDAATDSGVFLDIADQVNDSGSEEGLLGLAFHPDFASNGYFFVNYTASSPDRTVIARYRTSDENPDIADENSAEIILEVAQPYSNHNGGQIVFGPDGYLYNTFGDGGSGGDPHSNSQNRSTLLGSLIRIDVDSPGETLPYGIPPNNPFAGNEEGYREEIYAYGLRNAWRFSFDVPTGRLWAGDVGQNRIEEIDLIEPGGNYGWNIMEGTECYQSENCDSEGLILPVVEYDHSEGRSVTGGFVYRGSSAASTLAGKYVYADYVSGNIWTLEYTGEGPPVNRLLMDSNLNISSFGIDADDELYALDHGSGRIYRFESDDVGIGKMPDPVSSIVLGGNIPNPFNTGTDIIITHAHDQDIDLVIYNSAGQAVRHLAHGYFSAGTHRLFWNGASDAGDHVGAGLYLYRIVTAQSAAAGAMMLLK